MSLKKVSDKNEASGLAVSQLRGSTAAIISVHMPDQGECWPWPEFKFSKTVEVGWWCKDLQLCQDRSLRSSYGWLVSNTVDDCLQRQIAKKIFKSKIEARPVKAGHYMAFKHHDCISFATDLIMPDIVYKLLCAAIWCRCAVQFESEQTPFSRTGRFRSAALRRIRFRFN